MAITIEDVQQNISQSLAQLQEQTIQLIVEARLEGFKEGMEYTDKVPSYAQFKRDHKVPAQYADGDLLLVDSVSPKTAAKLLDVDEDAVEVFGVDWKPYLNDEGDIVVGYYAQRNALSARWQVYGVEY